MAARLCWRCWQAAAVCRRFPAAAIRHVSRTNQRSRRSTLLQTKPRPRTPAKRQPWIRRAGQTAGRATAILRRHIVADGQDWDSSVVAAPVRRRAKSFRCQSFTPFRRGQSSSRSRSIRRLCCWGRPPSRSNSPRPPSFCRRRPSRCPIRFRPAAITAHGISRANLVDTRQRSARRVGRGTPEPAPRACQLGASLPAATGAVKRQLGSYRFNPSQATTLRLSAPAPAAPDRARRQDDPGLTSTSCPSKLSARAVAHG